MSFLRMQLENMSDGKKPYPIVVNADTGSVISGAAWAQQLIGYTRAGHEEITISLADARKSEPQLVHGLHPVFTEKGRFVSLGLAVESIIVVEYSDEEVAKLLDHEEAVRATIAKIS